MSDSKPPLDPLGPVRALLSIKPRYVAAIFAGEKKYEFRRAIFARHVDIIVVYASAPVRRVVGEFDVNAVISAPLRSLWEMTRQYAGVDEGAFYGYFRGRQTGYAIQIGEVRQYAEPFCPIKRFGVKPPQSFLYLSPGDNPGGEKAQPAPANGAGAPKDAGGCGPAGTPFSQ